MPYRCFCRVLVPKASQNCVLSDWCTRPNRVGLQFHPPLLQIHPLSGPVEGGTLVTIEGSNLGLREEDVHNNVFIGDLPCAVEGYYVSVKILCRTGEVPSQMLGGAPQMLEGELHFPVRVATPAGTTVSSVKFSYTVRTQPPCPSLYVVLPRSENTTNVSLIIVLQTVRTLPRCSAGPTLLCENATVVFSQNYIWSISNFICEFLNIFTNF